MATVQLANTDARLTYLALQYHLARPGSELEAGAGADGTLRDVADVLESQLEQAVATIELNGDQLRRLDGAISGSINELKSAQLLEAGGKSMMPSFVETLHRLFPNVAADPEEALPLAGHMLQLRRRLATTDVGEETQHGTPSGAWWKFWQR
jgi:hypothetical protein